MIKASLIILLGMAVTAALRRRSAAVRHWVLAATLACAAAIPALELIAPAWNIRPATEVSGDLTALQSDMVPIGAPVAASPSRAWQAEALLAPIWIAGIAINLLVLLAGFSRLLWFRSRARRITRASWQAMAGTLCAQYGITRPVRLLHSEHPTLLVTWGLARPTIILPAAAGSWTDDRLRIVLGHELAHVQRGDWIVHIGAELLRAAYWFNPLVWVACRQLRRESELACDDAVLRLGVDGADYADELVDLARAFRASRRTWLPVSVAPAMARSSHFERRVRAMLNASLNRTPLTRFACIAIVIALVGVTLPIAGFGAQTGPASFSGSLLDMHGRILPNEEILLTNPATGVIHQTRSDGSAQFRFDGLPAGDYELQAKVPGFQSRYRVTVRAGQSLVRNVTLQLGSLQETISVHGDGTPSKPRQNRPVIDISEFLSRPQQCPQTGNVGGCIQQPTKVRDVRPVFPEGRGASSAVVLLECMIGTDGFVKALHLAEPADLDFAKSAMDAVNQWQFTPTRLNGVTVETAMRVTVNFNQ